MHKLCSSYNMGNVRFNMSWNQPMVSNDKRILGALQL